VQQNNHLALFEHTAHGEYTHVDQERIPGGYWGDRPSVTYESNFIRHDLVQFGKQYSRYKAILPLIVLSQQCCEVYFISLIVVNS